MQGMDEMQQVPTEAALKYQGPEKAEERVPELFTALDGLTGHIDRLEHQAGRLEERLVPLRRPDPQRETPRADIAESSPVRMRIDREGARVFDVSERLIALLDSIDV